MPFPCRDRARSADRARVASGDAQARIEIGTGSDAPIETQVGDNLGPAGIDRFGQLGENIGDSNRSNETEIDADLGEFDILVAHRKDRTAKRVESFTAPLE